MPIPHQATAQPRSRRTNWFKDRQVCGLSETSFIQKKKKRQSGINYLWGSVTEEKLSEAPCASKAGQPCLRAKSGAELLNPADNSHNINIILSKITSPGMIAPQAGPRPAPASNREGLQGLWQELAQPLVQQGRQYHPSTFSITDSPLSTAQNDPEFVVAPFSAPWIILTEYKKVFALQLKHCKCPEKSVKGSSQD